MQMSLSRIGPGWILIRVKRPMRPWKVWVLVVSRLEWVWRKPRAANEMWIVKEKNNSWMSNELLGHACLSNQMNHVVSVPNDSWVQVPNCT